MIPSFTLGRVMIKQISHAEYRKLLKQFIKKWHFEKTDRGYKPVSDE
jgi:hypothetical protein